MRYRLIALAALSFLVPNLADAQECWALSDVKGQAAFSDKDYAFEADRLSKSMILCFEAETGTVSGDDTRLTRFGTSTLAGWVKNKGIELFEVYQIDRTKGKVLFTKSRIGTNSVLPGGTDIVAAFVGKAVKLK